uniref:FERM_f0 domain-containing protein n=1 Tax=Heterorhabditis bacteriophora TaxID=37862 RepID=A0A1I7WU93_HETBA
MGVITLNVVSSEKGTKKTMQFEPSTLVYDVCKVIREKMMMTNVDPTIYTAKPINFKKNWSTEAGLLITKCCM